MKNRILMASIKLQTLLASEEGQDLIEYALVVALVAFGATAAMGTLATKISNTFTQIGTSLSTTITSASRQYRGGLRSPGFFPIVFLGSVGHSCAPRCFLPGH